MSVEVNETVDFLKTRGVRTETRGRGIYFIIPQQAESGHVAKSSISAAASLIVEQLIGEVPSTTAVETALKAMEEEELNERKKRRELERIACARRAASVKEIAERIEAFMQNKEAWRGDLWVLFNGLLQQINPDNSLFPRRFSDFKDLFYECVKELDFAGIGVRLPPTPKFELGHVPPRIRKQKPK